MYLELQLTRNEHLSYSFPWEPLRERYVHMTGPGGLDLRVAAGLLVSWDIASGHLRGLVWLLGLAWPPNWLQGKPSTSQPL